jgi:hypothetical protein
MRQAKLKLKADSGTINRFLVFLGHTMVIADDGTATPKWSGSIVDAHQSIKVRVTGINDATYIFGFTIENSADDQQIKFALSEGFHEFEIIL